MMVGWSSMARSSAAREALGSGWLSETQPVICDDSMQQSPVKPTSTRRMPAEAAPAIWMSKAVYGGVLALPGLMPCTTSHCAGAGSPSIRSIGQPLPCSTSTFGPDQPWAPARSSSTAAASRSARPAPMYAARAGGGRGRLATEGGVGSVAA